MAFCKENSLTDPGTKCFKTETTNNKKTGFVIKLL